MEDWWHQPCLWSMTAANAYSDSFYLSSIVWSSLTAVYGTCYCLQLPRAAIGLVICWLSTSTKLWQFVLRWNKWGGTSFRGRSAPIKSEPSGLSVLTSSSQDFHIVQNFGASSMASSPDISSKAQLSSLMFFRLRWNRTRVLDQSANFTISCVPSSAKTNWIPR